MNYPEDFINKIILGDCLYVLPNIPDEVVDLIYLDPPFGENNIDALYGLKWRDKAHYIDWMQERLVECKRVLKSMGSIYLHCDYHSNAHLRIMMDDIFGEKNFRNEIIWCYSGREKPNMMMFSRKHDNILFYTKTNNYVFNLPFKSYRKEYIKQFFTEKDRDGRIYRIQLDGKGEEYKQYLNKSKGQSINDSWIDIKPIWFRSIQKEVTGYPSQKPVKLLKRIIEASSNRDDIILDPMCGNGTTPKVAWDLMRDYIGIGRDKNAVNISRNRLRQRRID